MLKITHKTPESVQKRLFVSKFFLLVLETDNWTDLPQEFVGTKLSVIRFILLIGLLKGHSCIICVSSIIPIENYSFKEASARSVVLQICNFVL